MKCPICGNDEHFKLLLGHPGHPNLWPQGWHCQCCHYVIVEEERPPLFDPPFKKQKSWLKRNETILWEIGFATSVIVAIMLLMFWKH